MRRISTRAARARKRREEFVPPVTTALDLEEYARLKTQVPAGTYSIDRPIVLGADYHLNLTAGVTIRPTAGFTGPLVEVAGSSVEVSGGALDGSIPVAGWSDAGGGLWSAPHVLSEQLGSEYSVLGSKFPSIAHASKTATTCKKKHKSTMIIRAVYTT